MEKVILVASASDDVVTWRPVVTALEERGFQVIVYEADKVADGTYPLDISIDNNASRFSYKGSKLDPKAIAAAWYRRPNSFGSYGPDKAKHLILDKERKEIQRVLWQTIAKRKWLNDPRFIHAADKKLAQLMTARAVGFAIPQTITTNQWNTIANSLPEDIILKMTYGVIYDKDTTKCLYTTRLKNSLATLPMSTNPFPGFWQPYIQKQREWRVTVIGSTFFDVAIYTKDKASDDWRIGVHNAHTTFKVEPFPAKLKPLCLAYLKRFGLRFGAFDFIETPDGQIIFLECNPNGQYHWLEEQLGLPISSTIAYELATIAAS